MSQLGGKKKKYQEILPNQVFGKLRVIKNVGYPTYVKSRINYYLCECDCGIMKEIRRNHLLSGRTTSCGCGIRERNLKQKGEISYTALYNICRNSAKKRNLVFDLTKEEHRKIIQMNCRYCGAIPSYFNISLKKDGTSKTKAAIDLERAAVYANGVDRIDSSIGYTIKNCAPCCTDCNRAKWENTEDEFISHCKRVVDFNKKRNGHE